MDGILLVDKPLGWTSFDVVAKIRGFVRQATGIKKPKVGHTGTLDPLATGLMIVVVGSYCKRASEFSKLDKTYEVTMKLGWVSTTGDKEGEKHAVNNKKPAQNEIQQVVTSFVGESMQVPPAYSAIKVNGQRAYDLARAGKIVTLEPRKVTIYSSKLTDYTYPDVHFTALVSSGTYIRSLVQDMGTKLGTGAYMSALRRTTVGTWSIENAINIGDVSVESLQKIIKSA